jgi:hypothetical protein
MGVSTATRCVYQSSDAGYLHYVLYVLIERSAALPLPRQRERNVVRMFTLEDIRTGVGEYMNVDGIPYDLDGRGLAEHLEAVGATVYWNGDRGRYGQVIFGIEKDIYSISTNGYVTEKGGQDEDN